MLSKGAQRGKVENLLESYQLSSVLYVPDGKILLPQLIHNFIVFRMISSQHKEGMIAHLAKVLKCLCDQTKWGRISDS